MSGLEGKVALVTGAAAKRSMGRAIAAQLAEDGAYVVVADREAVPRSIWPGDEDWAGLAAVVGEVEGRGGKALAVTADVSVAADVEAMVAQTVEEFGKLDILVHCVGVRGPVPVPVIDLDEATWRMLLDVNLTGAFLTAKAAAKAMLADPAGTAGKKIILVSSMAGVSPYVGGAGYCASKHGVLGLDEDPRPGAGILQDQCERHKPRRLRDQLPRRQSSQAGQGPGHDRGGVAQDPTAGPTGQAGPPPIPLGRLGTPHDIADLVSFLVSEKASYITGEDINLESAARANGGVHHDRTGPLHVTDPPGGTALRRSPRRSSTAGPREVCGRHRPCDQVPLGRSPGRCDWSDPENRITFFTGPLAGTRVCGSGTFSVTTMGACTNMAAPRRPTGFMGAFMRFRTASTGSSCRERPTRWTRLHIAG